MTEESQSELSYQRVCSQYKDLSQRFSIKEKDINFSRQYAHIYAERLERMRENLTEAAKSKWSTEVPILSISDLVVDNKCIIVGIIYKEMELRPSILKEIAAEEDLCLLPKRTNYICPTDTIFLEDNLQKVALLGKLQSDDVVTGVVCALLGYATDAGFFDVEDCLFQNVAPHVSLSFPAEDKYVLFVSGFEVSEESIDLFVIQLLIDLINGHLGLDKMHDMMSKVTRVVIAGNLLGSSTVDRDFGLMARYLLRKAIASSVEAIKIFDSLLVQLVAAVDVDVMPGCNDPANALLPQQPLHHCMFPLSSPREKCHFVTNPYECEIDGIRILGTSGQNIDDIKKFSSESDSLQILQKTLEWGHLCPSAPDTLGCYPLFGSEPFIIETCPCIYFAGNQDKLQHEKINWPDGKTTLLLALPRFSSTHSAAVVNLKTLDVIELNLPMGNSNCKD